MLQSPLSKTLALLVALASLAGPALAVPTTTSWGRITTLAGGWTEAHLRIVLDAPLHNPSGCALSDGYIVSAALPGAQLLQSMLIAAYASGDEVILTVDGCTLDRPNVISVQIRKNAS